MTGDDASASRETGEADGLQFEHMARIAGGFAHNFNNLLTVITGNLQLVEMRVQDPSLAALLREASLACAMGARMTERLLTYAQQRRLTPAAVDINAELRSMRSVLELAAGEANEMVMTHDETAPPVLLDRSEFESAVLNLVLNARDAMRGGGTLTIATSTMLGSEANDPARSSLRPGKSVVLTVRDTGTGMAPHVLRRACEPFFSTKDAEKGTGLGLATVQGFVEQSGGALDLQSSLGKGTTVTLYFPAA